MRRAVLAAAALSFAGCTLLVGSDRPDRDLAATPDQAAAPLDQAAAVSDRAMPVSDQASSVSDLASTVLDLGSDASCGPSTRPCGSSCIPSASCCSASDCTAPPGPGACYLPTCPSAGGSCSYTLKPTATVCSGICCNSVNGTCNGSCMLTCAGGFADCDGNPANGCETNLVGTNQKLCGNVCAPTASCCSAADCTSPPNPSACYNATCTGAGGTCVYPLKSGSRACGPTCCNAVNGSCNADCTLTCASGFGDCNNVRSDGCELITNTLSNCTACGVTCDMVNSLGAMCTGSGCAYSGCKPGRIDCSAAAPNAMGCACATSATSPGCCGAACQNVHSNGIGQNFYDCVALNTFDQAQAIKACVAHSGNPAQCVAFTCMGFPNDEVICDNGGTGACNCWDYSAPGKTGANAGRVDPNNCLCPGPAQPTWN